MGFGKFGAPPGTPTPVVPEQGKSHWGGIPYGDELVDAARGIL